MTELSKKGKRLLALLRKFIQFDVDFRVTMIEQNKQIKKCKTIKGENLKNLLRVAFRYMVEDMIKQI